MSKISRRALARYGAQQLLAGKPADVVAKYLAAALASAAMTDQVDFLLGDISWELENQGQLAVGHIVSARSLSSQLQETIRNEVKLAAKTKAVLLEERIDKSVIGGVRIETSGQVWDSTVSRKLTNLREAF